MLYIQFIFRRNDAYMAVGCCRLVLLGNVRSGANLRTDSDLWRWPWGHIPDIPPGIWIERTVDDGWTISFKRPVKNSWPHNGFCMECMDPKD